MSSFDRIFTTLSLVFIFTTNNSISTSLPNDENENLYYEQKQKFRISTGINYFKNTTLFADLIYSGIQPLTYIEYLNNNNIKKKKLLLKTSGYSLLQAGVEYNITNSSMGIRLGVFQLLSPISFNPVQFIYQKNSDRKGWVYRPEAGIGFWIFQLNYGFNIFLKSDFRNEPRHNLIFKINLPF